MGTENQSVINLHAFLREVKHRPFQWGVWDCLIFTNSAFKAMHGDGWADDILGRYMNDGKLLTRQKIRQEYGYQTIDAMLSDRFDRAFNVPPRGALVVCQASKFEENYLGVSFGISVGSSAALLSSSGVVYCPIETIDSAWVRYDAA